MPLCAWHDKCGNLSARPDRTADRHLAHPCSVAQIDHLTAVQLGKSHGILAFNPLLTRGAGNFPCSAPAGRLNRPSSNRQSGLLCNGIDAFLAPERTLEAHAFEQRFALFGARAERIGIAGRRGQSGVRDERLRLLGVLAEQRLVARFVLASAAQTAAAFAVLVQVPRMILHLKHILAFRAGGPAANATSRRFPLRCR